MLRNCSAATLFGKADSKLSDLASLISLINQSEAESYEDIRLFGAPSECMTLVSKQYHYLRQEAFNQYQVTEEEFMEEVAERTSWRWIHWCSTLV